jgi:thiol-disulfide isomerase/thioredoxin
MKSRGNIMWARLSAVLVASLVVGVAFSAFLPTSVTATEGEPRKVILELLTATWCASCPYADEAADDLSRDYGPERFTVLQYHVANDGLDTPETNERRDDYNAGQTGLPAAWFDGTEGVHSVGSQEVKFFYDLYKEKIDERLNTPSPISISLLLTESSGELTVSASFAKLRPIIVPDTIHARFVLFENWVQYGGVFYNYVVRDVELKDFHYDALPYTEPVTFGIDAEWDATNMGVAVYVQAETNGEILQSASGVIGPEPSVTITTELDGSEVSGPTTIEGTASGSVAWVEVRIDEQRYEIADGTTSWSFDLDPSQLPAGTHTLRVRAYSNSLIYSDLAQAEFETTDSLLMYILVVVIIAVVILLAALIVRKRGKEVPDL